MVRFKMFGLPEILQVLLLLNIAIAGMRAMRCAKWMGALS